MKKLILILENSLIGGYQKEYLLDVDEETFIKKFEEDFEKFVEDKLCSDDNFGIYEYDGILHNDEDEPFVYIQICLDIEEGYTTYEDLKKTYNDIEKISAKYLRNKKLLN